MAGRLRVQVRCGRMEDLRIERYDKVSLRHGAWETTWRGQSVNGWERERSGGARAQTVRKTVQSVEASDWVRRLRCALNI